MTSSMCRAGHHRECACQLIDKNNKRFRCDCACHVPIVIVEEDEDEEED